MRRILLFVLVLLAVLLIARRNSIGDDYVNAKARLTDLVGLHPNDELQRQLVAPSPDGTADYNHTKSARLPKTPVSTAECGAITMKQLQELADRASFEPDSSPVVYHFHGGNVLTNTKRTFKVGTAFCSAFFVPQAPETNLTKYQNLPIEGWGPDALHALIWSEDIRLIFEHPDYWGSLAASPDYREGVQIAVYTKGYALNHPGKYQVKAEVEFSHYDWVMEDPMDEEGAQTYPYKMLERQFKPGNKEIIITGAPISRPVAKCYEDGHTDVHGRWYRAKAFNKNGRQTKQNKGARLDFAEHAPTTDEFGWTFAPDNCRLLYYSPQDHLDCFNKKVLQCLCDSNSRRLFKSLMGGGVAWCQDKDNRMCNCEDTWEETFQDMLFHKVNATRFQHGELRDDPTPFGKSSSVFFDYVGGLVNKKIFNGWDFFYDRFLDYPSIMERRAAEFGPMDLVHVSLLGWDMAAVKTPREILDALPAFREKVYGAYPNGTRFVTRLANSLCCGNVNHKTRYSAPRFAIWNAMWKSYWAEDEAAGRMRVIDVTVLQGRADAETLNKCPTTHFRASHVRLEQMLWMNAVCEKPDRGRARMREWNT